MKEYQYTSPHCWIILVAQEDGKEVSWGVEGSPPNAMPALGVVPSLVKSGVKVTMWVHPVKDGRSGGSFIDIRFPDGKYIIQRGGG